MNSLFIFQTERLIVRPFTFKDADDFFLLNSHEDVVRFIRPPKNRAESDLFLKVNIEGYTEAPLYGRWAVNEKFTGWFAGTFAIIPVEESHHMQLGYALLPAFWGKGYATELAIAGLHYVFHETPISILYAYTEPANRASQKVLLKAGFHHHGWKTQGNKQLVEFSYVKPEMRPCSREHSPRHELR